MDFTKTCWYCGRNDMEPFDGYYCCANCGATWNEIGEIKKYDLVEPRFDNAIGVPTGSPSDVLVREIQKARAAAGLDAILPKRRVIGIGKKIKEEEDATDI